MDKQNMQQNTKDAQLKSEMIELGEPKLMDNTETVSITIPQIIFGLISLAALVLSLFNFLKPHEPTVRIVDLAGISMTYQEQARNQGLQNGISNEQRAQILQNYQAKMNTLQQTVQEYVHDCNCNLFVKSAILGRNDKVEDVTKEIMAKMDKRIPAAATVSTPAPTMTTPSATPPSAALPDEGKGSSVNVK